MKRSFADTTPQHFRWQLSDQVATITLDRPEKKNPLTFESYAELRDLFRDLVYAIRACPQPIISAVDGICVGAGAILAMASDLRYGTCTCKTSFLFTRV